MEELFTKRIEEYAELKNTEINAKINSRDCFTILYDCENYIIDLMEEYSIEIFEIDFDEIECDRCPNNAVDIYGNPVESYTYTFKVPFKGNRELLDFRPNRGSYRHNTYFFENNCIVFQSLNYDLGPTPPRFFNSIKTLESIISNLITFYEEWDDELSEKVVSAVKSRRNILIEFYDFCKKYEISEERLINMEFKLAALEELSRIIADNNSGSQITILFKKAGFPEIVYNGDTKWKFVCVTFEEMQEESIEGFYKILKVLEVICDPQEYFSNPEDYNNVLKRVNNVLSFYGFSFDKGGNLISGDNDTKKESESLKVIDRNKKNFDVFICHSSKDKKRFVNQFVEGLKKYDIEPWYDDSEINGDNIISKVDNAIKESTCGIIIFSNNLKESKFALREKDALINKSIYDDYYILIPIKIEDIELPQLINPLQIIEIKDLNNFNLELNKIVKIISQEKSSISFSKSFICLPNCTERETLVFRELCNFCLDKSFDIELGPSEIIMVCQKFYDEANWGKLGEKIAISLENLEKQGYLRDEKASLGEAFTSKSITSKGFCFYFKNFIESSENKYLVLVSLIYNDKIFSLNDIVNSANLEHSVVEALVKILRKKEYIICKNDLTIIGVTYKGENYFKRILGEC